MKENQIKDPFQLLFALILLGNTRTLVIKASDRTITSYPFGYAAAVCGVLFITMPPLAVLVLAFLYLTGCSVAVEGPAPTSFRLVYASSAHSDVGRGTNVAEPMSRHHAPTLSSTPVERASIRRVTPSTSPKRRRLWQA